MENLSWADGLGVKHERVQAKPPASILTNREELLKAFEHLERVPSLRDMVQVLRDRPAFFVPSFDESELNSCTKLVSKLVGTATQLKKLVQPLLADQDPLSLSVRIPRPGDIEDLRGLLNDLRLVFEYPAKVFFGPEESAVSFQGFDVGSNWIELAWKSQCVMTFVFGIIYASAELRTHIARAQQEEARAKAMNYSVDFIGQSSAYHTELIKVERARLARELHDSFAEQRDPNVNANEAMNATLSAVDTWTKLVAEGATARPALNAPEDLKQNFADMEAKEPPRLPEFKQKLLPPAKAPVRKTLHQHVATDEDLGAGSGSGKSEADESDPGNRD